MQPRFCLLILLLLTLGFAVAVADEISPIEIGSRKQLFVDDHLIEYSDRVQLVMNSPRRDGEVLLTNDQPWETHAGMYINNYCCIMREDGVFRLWYDLWRGGESGHGRECYAESRDGIHFTKPVQNQYEVHGSTENNVVIPGSIGGCCVWIDPHAPPEHRYKTQAKVYPSGEFHMHSSPDGLQWKHFATPDPGPGGVDSQSVVFWDPRVKRYVLYTRFWKSHRHETAEKPNDHRTVRRLESDDLIHWDNQSIVMQPDEVDVARHSTPATPPGKPPVDYYGACVYRYGDQPLYIMFAQAYWHWIPRRDREVDLGPSGGPATLDVRLATSRDGIRFRLASRKPFMALGPDGRFDSRTVWVMPTPIQMGDEIWIYYLGGNLDHDDVVDPHAPDGRRLSSVGRAVLRLDGFVSAEADHRGGQITTPPLVFSGRHLELNIDTSGGGLVKVELVDKNGYAIPGFTRDDVLPVNGNSVRMPVRWKGDRDLHELAGKPVKVRFLMKECKLYAFQFVDETSNIDRNNVYSP